MGYQLGSNFNDGRKTNVHSKRAREFARFSRIFSGDNNTVCRRGLRVRWEQTRGGAGGKLTGIRYSIGCQRVLSLECNLQLRFTAQAAASLIEAPRLRMAGHFAAIAAPISTGMRRGYLRRDVNRNKQVMFGLLFINIVIFFFICFGLWVFRKRRWSGIYVVVGFGSDIIVLKFAPMSFRIKVYANFVALFSAVLTDLKGHRHPKGRICFHCQRL